MIQGTTTYEDAGAPDVRTDVSETVSYWGATIGGVFVILATLVLFSEIGAAIGLSAYEAGDRAGPYLLGAGVWALVSAAIAFFLGGFAATCLSRPRRRAVGIWNGVLVWAVAVPVIGVLAALLAIGATTAGAATATAASAAVVAERGVAPTGTAPAKGPELRPAPPAPETVEDAAKKAGAMGWGMVGALLLSLGMAGLGGALGTRYGAGARRRREEWREVGRIPVARGGVVVEPERTDANR